MRTENYLFAALISVVGVAALTGCNFAPAPADESTSTVDSAVVVPQTVTVSVPSSVDFRQVAVGAFSNLAVSDGVLIQGATPGTFALSTSTGTAGTTYGTDVQVGSVVSVPSVNFNARAIIGGSVTSAKAVTGTPASTPIFQNQPIQASSFSWTVPFDTSTTDVPWNSGTKVLAPGSYRNVQINGGTLSLSPPLLPT